MVSWKQRHESVVPIPVPEDKPSEANWEDDKAEKIKEAESQRIGVPQLLQEFLLPYSTTRDTFEHDTNAIVHRWYPREELDEWVCASTSINETPGAEVKECHRQVSYQNGHVLVVSHCTNRETKEAAREGDSSQCSHVSQKVCEGLEFELEAIERDWGKKYRVDPGNAQDLAEHCQVIWVHRVHVVWDLSLEDRVVLGYLHNLTEHHVDELVTAD